MSDSKILAQHDLATRIIAESVAGLVDKFADKGVTPMAVLEGSLKASVIVLAMRNGMKPIEIADLIEELADSVRRMPKDALTETMQ